ncbi:MAG TPA: PIN domain-containing protein [Bryobacteraceae bacterium]|jgi:predicted nucleic acid-binding protein
MPSLAFFDSKMLVYADDASVGAKRQIARDLLKKHVSQGTAVFSLQVLQEYYAVSTRKLGLAPDVAQERVRVFGEGRVVCFEVRDVIAAIELHRLTRMSFWDSLIVHAARTAGAAILYTEDLQNNRIAGGVRIVNPFAAAET